MQLDINKSQLLELSRYTKEIKMNIFDNPEAKKIVLDMLKRSKMISESMLPYINIGTDCYKRMLKDMPKDEKDKIVEQVILELEKELAMRD